MPRKKSENTCPASNTMLVLALLEGGDKYGYQIIRELECRSDQTFSMKEGTLYPILHGLEERGEVRSYERESDAGRRRRDRIQSLAANHALDVVRRYLTGLPVA